MPIGGCVANSDPRDIEDFSFSSAEPASARYSRFRDRANYQDYQENDYQKNYHDYHI